MPSMRSHRPLRAPVRLGVALLAPLAAFAAVLALGVPTAGAGDPTCQGKPATIVSDAATIYGERGVDKIYGEGGDDVIYGERGSDTLDGGEGNDKIYGGRGSDEIEGGGGTDLVEGEQGNDTVNGGEGDGDTVEG